MLFRTIRGKDVESVVRATGEKDVRGREPHGHVPEVSNPMDKKSKFDYGESIRISKESPEKYHPSESGFICGMIDIDSEEAAVAYACIGSGWLYTVELLNGSSLQIPEKYLKKDNNEQGDC